METFSPQPTKVENTSYENQKGNKPDLPPEAQTQQSNKQNQSKTTFTYNKHEAKTTNIETGLLQLRFLLLTAAQFKVFY